MTKRKENAMLKTVLIAALTAIPAASVVAQDIFVPPVTTANPGYLFPNDQYQRDRQDAGSSADESQQQSVDADVPVEVELDAAARARVQSALEALVPEYHERFQRDGEVSANDWIRQKAFELGQIEAEHMKQRLGLD